MPRLCSTKFVATLGPASSTPAQMTALFEAGAEVVRLIFSHGSHDDHRARLASARAMEAKVGSPIGVLMDLQGPKLRVGAFAGGKVQLVAGQRFRFDLDAAPGDATRVQLPHREVFAALEEGTDLLLDDGRLRLRVTARRPDLAECEVVVGGTLSDRKGVNVPGALLPLSPLTEKDRRDLAFGL